MAHFQVIAVNLVYTVCGSTKSALGLSDAFIKEFESVTKDMAQENIDKEPFLAGNTGLLLVNTIDTGLLFFKIMAKRTLMKNLFSQESKRFYPPPR